MRSELDSQSGAGEVCASKPTVPWWRGAVTISGVIGVLCFANTLPNDYCFDDVPIVRDNPRVNEPGHWSAVFTKDHWAEQTDGWKNRDLLYRPITLASYRLVHLLCGSSPLWQHSFNVLLHGFVCALLSLVCLQLTVRISPRNRTNLEAPRGLNPAAGVHPEIARANISGSQWAALVGGVAFAVVPIHTETVASVVGRSDLLAATGVLVALLAHRRGMTARERGPRRAWRVAALVACLVAMAAKENGMAVVPALVLFDAYWHWSGRADRSSSWWHKSTVGRLAYVLVPMVLYLSARLYVLDGRLAQAPPETKTVNVLVDAGLWQHALGVVQLWGMYWAKTFWPAELSIKYSIQGIRLATSPLNIHVLVGALAAGMLVLFSAYGWRRGDRRIALLSAVMLLCYLPTSNAIVLMQVFFAERIWYLPSIWLCLLLGYALASHARRSSILLSLLLIALGMGARCFVRNAEWRDNATLYASAYRDSPDSVGPLQLYGDLLVRRGEFEQGLTLLHRAIEIDLGYTDAYRSLGRAYLTLGDFTSAVRHLQTADMQAPGHPPTQRALTEASERLSAERASELDRVRAAVLAQPTDRNTALAWVRVLRDVGRLEEAVAFQRREDPVFAHDAEWQYEFAVTLVFRNDTHAAIDRYQKSLAISPDIPQRVLELAMLLLERRGPGDLDDSERLARRAATLVPNAPPVLACQAEILVARGNVEKAVALLRQAADGLPAGHPQRRVFLERARALGAVDRVP